LISIWICTLARWTRITSNLFCSLLPNGLKINLSMNRWKSKRVFVIFI